MKKKLNCILLIDDDEPTNYYNSLIIEQTGCANHVCAVQSGQNALDYLTASEDGDVSCNGFPKPDIIFLDINMPAMNGWEFLEKYQVFKKDKPKTVLVMLTTSLFSEDLLKAREMPEISGFESKPLTQAIIDKILDKYFSDSTPVNIQDTHNISLQFSQTNYASFT